MCIRDRFNQLFPGRSKKLKAFLTNCLIRGTLALPIRHRFAVICRLCRPRVCKYRNLQQICALESPAGSRSNFCNPHTTAGHASQNKEANCTCNAQQAKSPSPANPHFYSIHGHTIVAVVLQASRVRSKLVGMLWRLYSFYFGAKQSGSSSDIRPFLGHLSRDVRLKKPKPSNTKISYTSILCI